MKLNLRATGTKPTKKTDDNPKKHNNELAKKRTLLDSNRKPLPSQAVVLPLRQMVDCILICYYQAVTKSIIIPEQ